jgi:proteasome assembly chaperone (PAC2) family protein
MDLSVAQAHSEIMAELLRLRADMDQLEVKANYLAEVLEDIRDEVYAYDLLDDDDEDEDDGYGDDEWERR